MRQELKNLLFKTNHAFKKKKSRVFVQLGTKIIENVIEMPCF